MSELLVRLPHDIQSQNVGHRNSLSCARALPFCLSCSPSLSLTRSLSFSLSFSHSLLFSFRVSLSLHLFLSLSFPFPSLSLSRDLVEFQNRVFYFGTCSITPLWKDAIFQRGSSSFHVKHGPVVNLQNKYIFYKDSRGVEFILSDILDSDRPCRDIWDITVTYFDHLYTLKSCKLHVCIFCQMWWHCL